MSTSLGSVLIHGAVYMVEILLANQSNVCGACRVYPNQPTKTVSGNQKIAVTDVVWLFQMKPTLVPATQQNRQQPSGFVDAGASCLRHVFRSSESPRPQAILSTSAGSADPK